MSKMLKLLPEMVAPLIILYSPNIPDTDSYALTPNT